MLGVLCGLNPVCSRRGVRRGSWYRGHAPTGGLTMTANPPPALPPGFPPELSPLAVEIHTYFREFPRLLADGEEGKIVLVKGNELFGVWDTYSDAIQYGYLKFEDRRFLAQEIDNRFLDAFGQFSASHPSWGPPDATDNGSARGANRCAGSGARVAQPTGYTCPPLGSPARPSPVTVEAIIDTGAERSCVDPAVATRAALPFSGSGLSRSGDLAADSHTRRCDREHDSRRGAGDRPPVSSARSRCA